MEGAMDTDTEKKAGPGGGQVDAVVKPIANGGLIPPGDEGHKKFCINPCHKVFVHPGGAGALKKLAEYHRLVIEIRSMRPDLDDGIILQYARKNTATTTDTFYGSLLYCKHLVMEGKPLPWEEV